MERKKAWFVVKYYAGSYKGTREVRAEDEDEAIAIVRAWVHRSTTMPMYAEGYKVVDAWEGSEDE